MTVADNTLYYFGQRVIVDRKEIAMVIHAPKGYKDNDHYIWVRFMDGLEQFRAYENVRPLPNGEL